MKRIDVMRQISTKKVAKILAELMIPIIEHITGEEHTAEELELAVESWEIWLESELLETKEKLYTRDILAVKFNKDETSFLSEDDWDIIKALERMSKADPEGFMSEILKLVKRLQRRCDGERKARYNLINQINALKCEKKNFYKYANELKSEISILTDANKNLQELYREEQAKVETAKQKVIDAFKKLNTAKSEAVKEFAEKLKEHSCNLTEYDEGGWNDTVSAVKVENIDRLLEEMGCNDG